jgi:uncharacterized RDD family membrane protein YckC
MSSDDNQQHSTNPFQPSSTQSIQFRRVGFGPRAIAFIIDVLISIVFAILLTIGLMQLNITPSEMMQKTIDDVYQLYEMFGIADQVGDLVSRILPALTLGSVIAPISYSLIEGLTGASPGKRFMRLLIATPDGRAGSTALFVRRWAVKNISAILNFIALIPTLSFVEYFGSFAGFIILIGFFFALSESKMALHDRIAVTAVFNRDDVTP